MTKFLIAIFFTYVCCTAPFTSHSSEIEYSRQVETTAYTSKDEAAMAALMSIMPTSEHSATEYAGVIIQIGKQFFYTSAVTNSETAKFSLHALMPKNAKFVAIYHTHPGFDITNEQFSPGDVQIAKQLNVTSYIGIPLSGHIKRYVPGEDKVQTFEFTGNRARNGEISSGTLIS